MIDIHSHILPGVDDGSDCIDTSLGMLRAAYDSGVHTIAATPHFDRRAGYDNYATEELEERFKRLKAEAAYARIPIRIVRGMEIMASDDLPELLAEGRVWTLGDSDYFMAEFRFGEEADRCLKVLDRCAAHGFKPIVAHPERYACVQSDPQTAYIWCRSGYGLQLNRSSLTGSFGEAVRVTAMRLISHGLAACVASDAHGVTRRTAGMRDVRNIVEEEFGPDHAELLLERNPHRILEGKRLLGFEPYPFD